VKTIMGAAHWVRHCGELALFFDASNAGHCGHEADRLRIKGLSLHRRNRCAIWERACPAANAMRREMVISVPWAEA
jgi:hypothetical protein